MKRFKTMAERVQPFEAFNAIISDSIIVLDCAGDASMSQNLIPGSGVVITSAGRSLEDSLSDAYENLMDGYCPDNRKLAVILDDGSKAEFTHDATHTVPADLDAASVGEVCANLLISKFNCNRALCVRKAAFMKQYGFLACGVQSEMPVLPAEILEGELFLGSICSLSELSLQRLCITHIVSILDREPGTFPVQAHLKFTDVPDSLTSDLTTVIEASLPFIHDAIKQGGRVLVHCEQGRSRSASIVVAYLMATFGLGSERALDWVQRCRPFALPNTSFLRQLQKHDWQVPSVPSLYRGQQNPYLTALGYVSCSQEDLTRWIVRSFRHFDRDNCPEKDAVKIRNTGSWLQSGLKHEPVRVNIAQLGFELQSLLSREECWCIIKDTEAIGYGRTSYPQGYRGNRRLQIDDVSGNLAETIWQRIQPHVPPMLEALCEVNGEVCRWRAVGCNTRFRFSKYFPGDKFAAHCDASYVESPAKRSFFTVNVNLNDLGVEQKGLTRFFQERGGEVVGSSSGKAGSASIFVQEEVIHDGDQLQCGLKYLLRTDVVYEKVV
eukprot:TRINITY_DN4345_c0_g1_i1.p1 TRINITY_DN4345_c0_g1~~TRINITY_DN4345_c0_g1_i1.p1  ORF type:complete len:551 (-),score=62.90 TRINITY_DN4345_c0_g1_i1:348-2000(-)